MKWFTHILLLVIVLVQYSCKKNEDELNCKDGCDNGEELIFHSGFEKSTIGLPEDAIELFTGTDSSVLPPNNWTSDLDNHSNIGLCKIQYQGGDAKGRFARIVDDPTGTSNKVLHFWLKSPNVDGVKGRIQMNLYDNNCLKEIYHKSRVFFHSDFGILQNAPEAFNWLTIFEYWNNANWTDEDFPFRITINIEKRDKLAGSPLYFGVHAQIYRNESWSNYVWEADDATTPIPIGTWITTEVYYKQGDKNNGRFYFAITPDGGSKSIIFDITDYTYHPDDPCPDGLTHLNPMKLYTSAALLNYMTLNGGVLQIYWDDFAIWKNRIP